MKKKIRPAVKELIKEADELAKSDEGEVSFDELFGEDEQMYITTKLIMRQKIEFMRKMERPQLLYLLVQEKIFMKN